MGDLNAIRETIRSAAARRRLERALHGLWAGLLAGSTVWLLILALFKVLPLPEAWVEPAWITPVIGAVAGVLAGGWRRVPLTDAARLVESRHGLAQRLSTALELSSTTSPPSAPDPAPSTTPGSASESTASSWTRLVVADAATAIRGLDLSRLLPLHLPAFARWIPLALALVVGLGFVPEHRSAAHRRKQQDKAVLRDAGRRVAELIRQDLQKREPFGEPVKEALEEAGQLGDRLAQAKLTKAESLGALSNAAERLREEARQLDSQPALQKPREAARSNPSTSTAPGTGNPALQKQLEKLQQSLGAPPEALEKLAAQLQEAKNLAAGMQGATPDGAAQQALSHALSQLTQSAAEMGLDAGALGRALDALKDLDMDRVLKNLTATGKDLDRLRDLARKMAEARKQMEQAGKDLAEQLDRGQAQAAAETLDRMAEKLQAAGLTPEQMEALVAEVTKALKPAGDYGKVAELLKAAAGQMKDSKKGDAAQNLAQAARELRDLAHQAQDVQQLADALEALQSAQIAIASGKMWKPGQCQGGACTGCALHPNGKIGWGRGGKPGRGVGTWAEENGWLYYPEITERWDNTGVDRPDMASRGQTDRGEGRLSENIQPTKLQGQFSPGPMPSITLRGVSIVGRSSVQYEQAVESAQSEAQSALNQDQVPRAYRGAVKGYFDDLK